MTRWRFAIGPCLAAVLWTGAAWSQAPDNGMGIASDRPGIEEEGGREAESEGQPADQFSVPVRIIEDREEAERVERRAQDAAQREQDDLAAQQSMAESTEALVLVSWYQIGLAAAGTIAIVTALVFSAWANIIASKALSTTREMAQRELRAYINVTAGQVRGLESGSPCVVLTFKNSGQTPAYAVENWTCHDIKEYPLITKLTAPPRETVHAHGVLGAGGEFHTVNDLNDPLPSAIQINMIKERKAALYVYGMVEYRDAFGEPRQTVFNLMYGGGAGPHPKGFMSPYPGHNTAT